MLSPGATNFLQSQTYDGSKPKAYVNWVLFDEQFKKVDASSGFEQVGLNEEFKTHLKADLPITKNGYLFVFVSNATPNLDVYFDNLQVTHYRGPILEESHYYPFGLVMTGISSKALNGVPENKKKYNGIEFENKFDINIGEAFYRNHDPQIGRWWQIDPKPESSLQFSSYVSMNDNPISLSDPLGDVVRYEALESEGVTRKEVRGMKREIREMRRNSESFNKMYKDLKRSKGIFVFRAEARLSGGNTLKPWEPNQNGVTTIRINIRMSPNKKIETIAHETGHGWRIAHKLDVKPELNTNPSMPANILGKKSDWDNYNKENDKVDGKNKIIGAEAQEQGEVGAMHIGNIVVSELHRSGNSKYSSLEFEETYSGKNSIKAVPTTSIYGNPTYQWVNYQTYYNKVPLDYYNNKIDIHLEHNVQPIKN